MYTRTKAGPLPDSADAMLIKFSGISSQIPPVNNNFFAKSIYLGGVLFSLHMTVKKLMRGLFIFKK